jgi:hypothetical protein
VFPVITKLVGSWQYDEEENFRKKFHVQKFRQILPENILLNLNCSKLYMLNGLTSLIIRPDIYELKDHMATSHECRQC